MLWLLATWTRMTRRPIADRAMIRTSKISLEELQTQWNYQKHYLRSWLLLTHTQWTEKRSSYSNTYRAKASAAVAFTWWMKAAATCRLRTSTFSDSPGRQYFFSYRVLSISSALWSRVGDMFNWFYWRVAPSLTFVGRYSGWQITNTTPSFSIAITEKIGNQLTKQDMHSVDVL